MVLVLAYIGGVGLYAHRVWLTISKGGPMHEVSNVPLLRYIVITCEVVLNWCLLDLKQTKSAIIDLV